MPQDGETPLSVARDRGHTAIVELLQVSWFVVVGDQRGCREFSCLCEAAEAVKRLRLEERLAALALEEQQVKAELGSGSRSLNPGAEDSALCVVCIAACVLCAQKPCWRNPTPIKCPVCRADCTQVIRIF